MIQQAEHVLRQWARRVGPDDLDDRLATLPNGYRSGDLDGFDALGYDAQLIRNYIAPALWLYYRYFRVEVRGIQHVPKGRALLIANHSGQIPFDGLMIACALLLEGDSPRFVRSMGDRWLPTVPFVASLFARTGQLVGHPDNCRRLLERDEAVLVFPEGVRGVCKPIQKRYQLQRFGRGFAQIATETQTPIVPVSVVGAEEQYISVANWRGLGRELGLPALPIMPQLLLPLVGWLPLPTRYRIQFGEPIYLNDADVGPVRSAIDGLTRDSLARRQSVFF